MDPSRFPISMSIIFTAFDFIEKFLDLLPAFFNEPQTPNTKIGFSGFVQYFWLTDRYQQFLKALESGNP